MGGASDDTSKFGSIKSWVISHGLRRQKDDTLPTHNNPATVIDGSNPTRATSSSNTTSEKPSGDLNSDPKSNNVADNTSSSLPPPAPPPHTQDAGETPAALADDLKPGLSTRMKKGTRRFGTHIKEAICYTWLNVLLVFVPIGIATKPAGLNPVIIFSMNAIAIIPLAGMLAHATESVAARLGDTLGALLNVSFGNAVELILFIILLAANQIRVVQAALLGSILANLLLILGMAFLLGGLRYQEQVYNSTVTQMSACMLSLSVMSLLLPTAFHSAFVSYAKADLQTLKVSRGTSVILLLVYILYLLFQLKSHAYMYASTPQHIIDEESHPGLLADILNSSNSSDSSSDSSSTDSDGSSGSHTTAKRFKRAFRNRKRRKSSASSKDTHSIPSALSSPSVATHNGFFEAQRASQENAIEGQEKKLSRRGSVLGAIMSGDEADTDDVTRFDNTPRVRDFEAGSSKSPPNGKRERRQKKSRKQKHKRPVSHGSDKLDEKAEIKVNPAKAVLDDFTAPKVAFAQGVGVELAPIPKRPFAIRPALPSLLSNNVFSNSPQGPQLTGSPALAAIPAGRPKSLRRTTSLPDRINRPLTQVQSNSRAPIPPHLVQVNSGITQEDVEEEEVLMSRTTAIMMLVISTALVAICADFMSDAIEPMVESTGISQAFIGLIILPIVGNAAEHVTAVTVAAKNKMDLAIGVAVGSSIQIAIFITPVIVILGWCMGKPMSLYFNIFETVALFATAFVVNFLILDGRSNYLEGSLLIAAYVIIAVASFFYPDGCDASAIGGQEGVCPPL